MRKKRIFSCEGQLTLFDLDILPIEYQTPEELIESLRHENVYRYRVKTIKSGNMLKCEIFPLYKANEAVRAKKNKPSREAQANLNHINTKKKIMRYTNANFSSYDLWGTFGYDNDNLPESSEAALKDIKNFIRRLQNRRKKLGLPPLRYLYVTEWKCDNEIVRCHHHVILSGGMDRDEIESLWKGGAYPQTRRLRVKEDCGLNGLASYLAKGSRCERMWGHSTNLVMPKPSVADKKITPRQAAKIAINKNIAPSMFEKACKGYIFRDIQIKHSEWVAGVYIYVQMYKNERGKT